MTLNEAYESYRSNPCDETLEILYPLVKEKVTRVVGRVTRRTPDEDLVVSITTDVLLDINNFNRLSQFSTWIENVARHDLIDELRKLSPVPPVVDELPAFQSYAFDKRLDASRDNDESFKWLNRSASRSGSKLKSQPDVEDALVELYERIETVLDNEDRKLLELRNAGYTTEEIAEQLGMPAGTIRWKFHEITNKLRVSNA